MSKRWIAIVNRTDARVFSERPFRRITQLRNLLGRAKNREMTTGVHAVDAQNSPHEDAAVDFAKEIGAYLHKAHAQNEFDELMLVAEPKMMGRVRAEMDKAVLACTEWVKKDLAFAPTADLPELLGLQVARG